MAARFLRIPELCEDTTGAIAPSLGSSQQSWAEPSKPCSGTPFDKSHLPHGMLTFCRLPADDTEGGAP